MLRELVRAILLEDEELLKKWTSQSENEVERELSKLGIYPIARGEKGNVVLGAGIANVVVDVVYKGRRAVARYSKIQAELTQLLKFVEFADRLPAKYKKHFPKVYTTFEFSITGGRKMYGAVVEHLEPLPEAFKHEIDSYGIDDTIKRSRITLLKDPEVIAQIARECAPGDEQQQEYMQATFEEDILPHLDGLVGKSIMDLDALLDSSMGHLSNRAYNHFQQKILYAVKGAVIPISGSDHRSGSTIVAKKYPAAKVREFYEFLEALKEAGFRWDDLHVDNFMMRKGTGDFVVVDPGYFVDHD